MRGPFLPTQPGFWRRTEVGKQGGPFLTFSKTLSFGSQNSQIYLLLPGHRESCSQSPQDPRRV